MVFVWFLGCSYVVELLSFQFACFTCFLVCYSSIISLLTELTKLATNICDYVF